jgi:hypothetical protein
MFKIASAILLCVLAGCSGTGAPRQDSVCTSQPGSFACQVERYGNVGA